MLHLASADLTLDLLDPISHRHLLGPRFCAGGFIWQVHDRLHGPRLSGPEGPEPSPDPFNGHGLPESFRHQTRASQPLTWRGERALAPGAGLIERRTSLGSARILEPCAWTTAFTPDHTQATYHTAQALADLAYTLERRITVNDRRITSATRFTNTGESPFPLEWFAHPFFALGSDGSTTATLPPGTTLPANPGFALLPAADPTAGPTLHFLRRFRDAQDGQFMLLALPPGRILETTVRSPDGPAVFFATSFVPRELPVWANAYTFSLEPYLAATLAPGETHSWTLTYDC